MGLTGMFQRPPKGPSPPTELDEYGLPVDWRVHPEDPDQQWNLDKSAEHWPIFEAWCGERSLKAFPASAGVVLRFLMDPPVSGPELYETWEAISYRHEAYYWMEDADPVYLLRHGHGVDVNDLEYSLGNNTIKT